MSATAGGSCAYVGIGANLGDREAACRRAVHALGAEPGLQVTAVSSLYETEPWGHAAQPLFLNCAAEIHTTCDVNAFFSALQRTEQRLHKHTAGHWGPRTIDIDLLLFGDTIVQTPGLQVPHSLMHRRRFVLVPLLEIAPQLVHPVLLQPLSRLVRELGEDGAVEKVGELTW